MNKLIALFLFLVLISACTRVDIAKTTVMDKIENNIEKIQQIAGITNQSGTADNTTIQQAIEKTEIKYETPSYVISKIKKDADIEGFGDVI